MSQILQKLITSGRPFYLTTDKSMKTTDIWPVARLIALIVQVPGSMACLSIVVAVTAGDVAGALAFAVTAIFAIGLGLALRWLLPAGHHPDFRETMVGCAAGWLVAAVVGTGPFLVIAYWTPADQASGVIVFRDFWSALFESMSGFTTTGLTMVERPSQLPVCLQWWRSFTQWTGGLGVIILVLAVVHPDRELTKLYRAEGHETAFGSNLLIAIRETWWIYVAFTLAGVVLLRLLGMSPWASLNHAMTAVSTGGFTVTDNGLASFGSGPRLGVAVLTTLGAISFVWHRRLLHRDWSRCRDDVQTRTFFALLAIGCLIFGLTRLAETGSWEVLTAMLPFISAMTTSGFGAGESGEWSGSAKMLLILAMIIGGCTGSAAGGVKIQRITTLSKEAAGFLKAIVLKPWLLVFRPAALAAELDAELKGPFTVATLFLVLWIGMIILASYLVALLHGPDTPLMDVVFDVTSALSITGLSTGVAASELTAGGKAIFILLMWMGRLEVLPVLVLLAWLAGVKPESESKTSPD